MQIEFAKMHGLGNDFIMVQKTSRLEALDLSILAKNISNRHLGLGCDQFILYEICDHEVLMYVYNQDGTKSGMCGNATRCLAKLLDKKNINIRVLDRVLSCNTNDSGNVSVNMGTASFNAKWMPSEADLWGLASMYKLEMREILCLDLGNPHLVIFKSNLTYEDKALIGGAMQCSSLFEGGINVSFIDIQGDVLKLKVWERGAGFTLACGSGACASFEAARKLGFVGDEAIVRFEFGELNMSSNQGNIIMSGSATLVAKGSYWVDLH